MKIVTIIALLLLALNSFAQESCGTISCEVQSRMGWVIDRINLYSEEERKCIPLDYLSSSALDRYKFQNENDYVAMEADCKRISSLKFKQRKNCREKIVSEKQKRNLIVEGAKDGHVEVCLTRHGSLIDNPVVYVARSYSIAGGGGHVIAERFAIVPENNRRVTVSLFEDKDNSSYADPLGGMYSPLQMPVQRSDFVVKCEKL